MHAQLMLTEKGGISGADAMCLIEKGSNVSIPAINTEDCHRAIL